MLPAARPCATSGSTQAHADADADADAGANGNGHRHGHPTPGHLDIPGHPNQHSVKHREGRCDPVAAGRHE